MLKKLSYLKTLSKTYYFMDNFFQATAILQLDKSIGK